jgi:CheY-like chemotaxis protein
VRAADEQSQRADAANQAKDEFLATLSHELRTPLNSILGWSRLLASGKLDVEQGHRAVAAIERAGWTQSRLIEDLLDISRIVAGRLEISPRPALVQPLIESAVESLRSAADAKRISVQTTLDATLGSMSIDPDRIRQVVWNLLSNAIKFTPSGGSVAVRLVGGTLAFAIIVEDSGIGFDPPVAAHLFERFRQGDSSSTRPFGGLGLGLGIVRHVVELHGGTVAASSAGAGQGSRFEARIPLRPAYVPRPEAAISGHPTPTLRGVSVLVVDDDPANLEFVRATLEQFGAIVVTAATVPEAEARIRREPPDVVVSDLMMPGSDGWELIREIRRLDREAGRQTPAAALTALARAEDRRKVLNPATRCTSPSRSIRPSSCRVWSGWLMSTEGASHHCSVLIIDDDLEVVDLLRTALTPDGYLVANVANGREAMDYLRSHAETCIILFELQLPVMDGAHFRTAQLRDRSLAWIPALAMSATLDASRKARELGARRFLPKPLDLDEVRGALRQIGCCLARPRTHAAS